jgi:membrane-associated protease RseP (regulator of RpoE activity)
LVDLRVRAESAVIAAVVPAVKVEVVVDERMSAPPVAETVVAAAVRVAPVVPVTVVVEEAEVIVTAPLVELTSTPFLPDSFASD